MYMGVTWVSPCPIGLERQYIKSTLIIIVTYHMTIYKGQFYVLVHKIDSQYIYLCT